VIGTPWFRNERIAGGVSLRRHLRTFGSTSAERSLTYRRGVSAQVGRVGALTLYPVRSLAGIAVDSVRVAPSGLVGDRVWTAIGQDGRPVRAKDEPAMRDVPATGDPASDAAALGAVLGRPVRLVATGAAPEVAPVHVVSRQSVERAARGDVPEGCSADDPRANLLLDLADDDERSWVGRALQVGDAVLQVTRTPKHCLGVYADVLRPGDVRVGDAVVLLAPSAGPAAASGA
jgi:uncharacterized protein YcbX